MQDFTAFTEGVENGGIRDSVSAKILLCYLLQNAGDLSLEDMNDILQRHGWMNYFEFTEAISELTASGHIETIGSENGSPVYRVTDSGAKTAAALEHSVSYSLRQKVVQEALRLRERKFRNKGCTCTTTQTDLGFDVTCSISDGTSDLLKLTLSVPDESMAEFIKSRFENDPLVIYRGLMELLDAAAPEKE